MANLAAILAADFTGDELQAHSATLDLLAALTTTAYGRAVLELANAAALQALLIADNRGSVWGNPIATASFSASPNVDFTGLSAYRELLLVGQGITHAGADQNISIRLSDDGGTVYDSSAYINAGSALTTGLGVTGTALTSATAFGFTAHLMDFNNATYKTRSIVMQGRESSTGGAPTPIQGRYGTARVNDAIRFTNSGAINWTAGEFLLYGRKG